MPDLAVQLMNDVSWEVRVICAQHKGVANQLRDDADWRVKVVADNSLNDSF